jgi:hypothetical protein
MTEKRRLLTSERETVRDVARAVATDDLDLLFDAFVRLHRDLLWPWAFRALVRQGERPSHRIQIEFVNIYSTFGIGVSRQLLTDREAVSALRLLLPPYVGPDMELYRGECAHNHRLGAYGLSWTPDRGVAYGHAVCSWQALPGGAVLLSADVPAAAIISAPVLLDDAPSLAKVEKQYICDRRKLRYRSVGPSWVAPGWRSGWGWASPGRNPHPDPAGAPAKTRIQTKWVPYGRRSGRRLGWG